MQVRSVLLQGETLFVLTYGRDCAFVGLDKIVGRRKLDGFLFG